MLQPEIEASLAQQELMRNDIPAARAALEDAVVQQFRLLARGMLAWEAVTGAIRDSGIWIQNYLAETADDEWTGDAEDPAFLAYREAFTDDVARGALRPLNKEALRDVKIRAYGGQYSLWQEGRINRQLATLGSDLRVCIIGSEKMRAKALSALVGKSAQGSIDGRFIAGYLRPITAHPMAPLFDFLRECAVSPLLPSTANGMMDDGRIILRELPLRMRGHRAPAMERASVMVHEMAHVRQVGGAPGMSLELQRVAQAQRLREDICRFTRVPRSRAEIETKLGGELSIIMAYSLPSEASVGEPELGALVASLIEERVIVEQSDGRLYCNLFEKGRSWMY